MKILKTILIFVLLISSTSCDCIQSVSGTVIDEQTKQPIQNAHIFKENKKYVEKTSDEQGNFAFESISGGLFTCPQMAVEIYKDGYETCFVQLKNNSPMTIELRRDHKFKNQGEFPLFLPPTPPARVPY